MGPCLLQTKTIVKDVDDGLAFKEQPGKNFRIDG